MGVYGLVIPCLDVVFPGVLVGHFTGGEPLRAVLPKDMKGRGHRNVQDKTAFYYNRATKAMLDMVWDTEFS